ERRIPRSRHRQPRELRRRGDRLVARTAGEPRHRRDRCGSRSPIGARPGDRDARGPAFRLHATDLGLLGHRPRGHRHVSGRRGADGPDGVRAGAPGRRPGLPPANRPGLSPAIITWADARSLAEFTSDLRALRAQADVVVASHHWGLFEEVLDYQVEIAHAAIDAGADVVMGHGPHYACAIEMYRGKPIFYALGSFSFHTGHGGRAHRHWVGMLACLSFDD